MHKATVLIPGRAGVWISVSDSRNLCLSSELQWPLQLEPPSPTEERALPPSPPHSSSLGASFSTLLSWSHHTSNLTPLTPLLWIHLFPACLPPCALGTIPSSLKQGRNPGSQKKMSCCYSTVIHTCSYRPFYRWLAVFTGYWLGIRDCCSFSLYLQIRVGGTLSPYLV